MPMQRFPLVGSLVNRNENPIALYTTDQIFSNCYPEIAENAITGSKGIYLNKRPGFTGSASVAGGYEGRQGATLWSSNSAAASPVVFSFTNGTNTKVFNSSLTEIGSGLANTKDCYSLTDTLLGTTGNLVAVVGDSATSVLEVWYFPEGGAWTQITDADFPPNIGTPVPVIGEPVFLDGFMFMMTKSGLIYNSDLNSISNWTATSFLQADAFPDGGCGLAKHRGMIVAFGRTSIQFFKNVGNPVGSPLSVLADATIRLGAYRRPEGAAIPKSIATIRDNVYWYGISPESGAVGIYRFNGMEPQKISPPAIDKYLNNPAVSATLVLGILGEITLHGQRHILFRISNVAGADVYAFCVETSFWWRVNLPAAMAATCGTTSASYLTYSSGSTDDQIFTISPTSYQDASGVTMTATVQTIKIDHGSEVRKFIPRVDLVADIQASGTTLLEYNDHDYDSTKWVEAGTYDMTLAQKSIWGLGSYVGGRAYRLTHSANTAWRGSYLDVHFNMGTS